MADCVVLDSEVSWAADNDYRTAKTTPQIFEDLHYV
jgi:hypothetical protein